MALKRNMNNKIIGGVCAGIANEMEMDPLFVRLVFAIAAFFTVGLPILIYILMWVLMPTE